MIISFHAQSLFLSFIKIKEFQLRSKPLEMFTISNTTMRPNFSLWIITNLEICTKIISHWIQFAAICGPQMQDQNRYISLEG